MRHVLVVTDPDLEHGLISIITANDNNETQWKITPILNMQETLKGTFPVAVLFWKKTWTFIFYSRCVKSRVHLYCTLLIYKLINKLSSGKSLYQYQFNLHGNYCLAGNLIYVECGENQSFNISL